jgi:hypothetical protein
MGLLYNLLVTGHFLGLAALIGGYLVAATLRAAGGPWPGPVMLWGARAQVVTGLLLVGMAEMTSDDPLNQVKIGVKLIIALAVAALTEIAAGRGRRGRPVADGMVHAAGGLAVVNVLVATLWT